MRPHRSLSLVPLLALVALGGCSPDDDTAAGTTAGPSGGTSTPAAPVLGDVSADGHCDPDVIDIDHGRPTMALIYNVPAGRPDGELTTMVHFTDPGRDAEPGGGFGYGGAGDGSRSSLVTGVPNEDIDHIEVTATTDDGSAGTCTIDVA